MNVSILPDGDLELSLEPSDDREEMRERADKYGDESVIWDALEPYWSNGAFEPFNAGDANPFVGLSSAPCIAESMNTHDDGRKEIVENPQLTSAREGEGRFWYYAPYMLRGIVEELLEHGRVVYTLARGS